MKSKAEAAGETPVLSSAIGSSPQRLTGSTSRPRGCSAVPAPRSPTASHRYPSATIVPVALVCPRARAVAASVWSTTVTRTARTHQLGDVSQANQARRQVVPLVRQHGTGTLGARRAAIQAKVHIVMVWQRCQRLSGRHHCRRSGGAANRNDDVLAGASHRGIL